MIPWYLIGINVCHVMSEMSGRDSELIFLSEKQTNKQTNTTCLNLEINKKHSFLLDNVSKNSNLVSHMISDCSELLEFAPSEAYGALFGVGI